MYIFECRYSTFIYIDMSFETNNNPDNDAPVYSIGVLADLLGISVQTLRLYESEGLIIPYKKDSGHRLYSHNDLMRLHCIRDAVTNKKLSLSSIKTLYSMIPCWSIKGCSEDQRAVCEAYNGVMEPCWSYKHKSNECESTDCRLCDVYKNHNNCESIKNSIKSI